MTLMWRVWAWRAFALGLAIFDVFYWQEWYSTRNLGPNIVVFDGPETHVGVMAGLAALFCLWMSYRTRRNVESERPPSIIGN
jgi:hypothetical protein